MFNNILVPLDGSRLAEAALPYARALATRTGASLTLMRSARYTSLLGDVAVDQLHKVEEAQEYIHQLAAELTQAGLRVQSGVPFGGTAAQWIVEELEIRHADLIVMATHDRTGPDRWLRGSVAEAVVHHASVPVMLVRGSDAEGFAARFGDQQPVLIVPLDGSELAEAALPTARDLAQATAARVKLLGVVPKPGQLVAGQGGAITTYAGSQHAALEANARVYLEGSVGRLSGTAATIDTLVRYGDAAPEIAAAAYEYRAAAVVMATHGRTGVLRSLLGSVAGGVVHQTGGPVVLIRAPLPQAAEEPVVAQVAMTAAD